MNRDPASPPPSRRTLPVLLAVLVTAAPAVAGTLDVSASASFSGSSGLEVSTGLSCISPDNLVVDSPATLSGTFTACDALTVEGVEVVDPGATFQATTVELGNDFSVELGAELTVEAGAGAALSKLGFLTDDSPATTTSFGASYRVNLDPLTLGEGEELVNLAGSSATGAHFQVVLTKADAQNRVFVRARLDDGTFADGPLKAVEAGWNRIEVKWVAGMGDGYLVMSINEPVAFEGVLDLDNDRARIDDVRWGAVGGDLSGTTGSLYLDDYSSTLF